MALFPLLYEINTRCWLAELSLQYGQPITLGNVPDQEISRWSEWGFTHIWLMGVWVGGPRARSQALADARQRSAYDQAVPGWREEDVVGSPYAIAAYQVPASLGGDAGLACFRGRLQHHGLRLILDFVPNHLGLDHPWVTQRPDLFVQSPAPLPEFFSQQTASGIRWLAHGKDPYFPAWTDTVQLDYRREETHAAMRVLLEAVARRCDGVRCDMAMLLLKDVFARTWNRVPAAGALAPGEFWREAIHAVRASAPGFLFLAEVYWGLESQLQALGFDYTYDKALYDKLLSRDAAAVHGHIYAMPRKVLAAGAHFLENHDEPRISTILSLAEHRPAALLVLALPGMRLLHEGQLSGARRRLPVQLQRRCSEPEDQAIRDIYEQLLSALKVSAVGCGQGRVIEALEANPGMQSPSLPGAQPEKRRAETAIETTAGNLVIVRWDSSEGEFDLAVVNLSSVSVNCSVPVSAEDEQVLQWRVKDMLTAGEYVMCTRQTGMRALTFAVPPHGAQLLHFTGKPPQAV